MSSTYQWILEDTDNKGFTTRVVIGLADDEHDEDGNRSGGLHSQHLSSDALHALASRCETQSEGKNSLSRRSHRSSTSGGGGGRSRKGGVVASQQQVQHVLPHPQRNSGSGSGSHQSSAGSATGMGRTNARRRTPVWMTTSVYGAEQLDDSEDEERVRSPTAGKRKARVSVSLPLGQGRGSRSKELHASESAVPQGTRLQRSGFVSAPCEDASSSHGDDDGEDTDDGALGRGRPECVDAEPQSRPQLVHSFGELTQPLNAETQNGNEADGENSSVHEELTHDPHNDDELDELDGEAHIHHRAQARLVLPQAPEPESEEERGRCSPVTATFYFTPNTNAEARASAEEAMRSGGLLYPLPSATVGGAPAPAPMTSAAVGATYNKKLHKKNLRRQHEESEARRGAGDHLSFSAAVEALARRAHRELHHMPDYDSDHERRFEPHMQDEESTAETLSTGSPGQSPDVFATFNSDVHGGVESSDEDVTMPSRSCSHTSSEDDFARYRRTHNAEVAKSLSRKRGPTTSGRGIGAPFPELPEPRRTLDELYDPAGFFISPIHQLVAESTSPWAQSRDGTGMGGGAFPCVFLGQGGLNSSATTTAATASAHGANQRRRRTISSGGSILRVPVEVELPPPSPILGDGVSVGQDRRCKMSSSTTRAQGAGTAPTYDREFEKAAEEGLCDHLSAVLSSHHGARPHTADVQGGRSHSVATSDSESSDFFGSVRRARAAQAGAAPPLSLPGAGRKRRLEDFSEDGTDFEGRSVSSRSSSMSSSSSTSGSIDSARETNGGRGARGGNGVSKWATPAPADKSGGQTRRTKASGSHENPYNAFTHEEQQVMKRLKRRRRRRRRLERANQECGGSQVLGPCPSPSIAPPLDLLPTSKADMREDLLESFFMDAKLHEDDFKLF